MPNPCLHSRAYKNNQWLNRGFSLVELSVGLAILGVVTAGGLTVGSSMVEQQANIASNTQLDIINKALEDYYQVNGRLPCVAPYTTAPGAAGFGTEVTPGAANCATNAGVPAGTYRVNNGGHWVRIGALPVRALGLRDRSIADEFGNRYTYAVTEAHTNAATFGAAQGAVILNDGGGTTMSSDNSFVVISHGADGKGAFRYQTASETVTCTGTGLDLENCNDDAVFRDARFNNGTVPAAYYDDFLRWLPKFRLTNTTAASGLWQQNSNYIYYNNGGIGIGTNNPGNAKLWVTGDVPADWLTRFYNTSTSGFGVYSEANGYGFYGKTTSAGNWAVRGDTQDGLSIGGLGVSNSYGVYGLTTRAGGYTGVLASSTQATSFAFYGSNTSMNYGCYIGDRNQYSLRCDGPGRFNDKLGVGGDVSTRILQITGDVEASSALSNEIVVSTSGPNSSSARLYMNTAAQSWGIGTARNVNSNDLSFYSNGTRVAAISTSGLLSILSFLLLSDERLKAHITPLDTDWALEKIKALQGVSYEWKKAGDPGTRYGFIAQEVEKILPDVVSTQDDGEVKDRKSIRYMELIALQNEAIKALAAQNEELGKRVALLEKH